MDGVLADFDKEYEIMFGARPVENWRRAKHFWQNWPAFIADEGFKRLQKHKDADKLLQFVHELRVPVEILSSSGGVEHHECVVAQKQAWLRNNGITYKANIVPGGSKKAAFAKPWHILVDDNLDVIKKYREAGGTAVHHYDIDVTLKELARLHLEWQGGE